MHHNLEIKPNAIFISDAHSSDDYRDILNAFLKKLMNLNKRQIFFMGDIFDLLIYDIEECIKDNKKTLELLEELSNRHEVYYFEGNHDFLLKDIKYFKNISYFSLQTQPVAFKLGDKKAYLAHGDIFLDWKYNLYTKIIRKPLFIQFLKLFKSFIYPKLKSHLKSKIIETKKVDSIKFATNRIQKYKNSLDTQVYSYIIEGHFHLGIIENIDKINYIGLPLFYCKKNFFFVELTENYCLSFKQEGEFR
ncbi:MULTISPECIES: UDP-2,3-diacylglucosamine diphosphatase [Helicobacter]|uniref:Metallophosphoesterase family protein n=1 Tax=Helicobacter ibis TaxID=2962633 RepID=A0ABT4VD00_9HELI|nr:MULTISPECIES: metallophosphoesterase [Helicobacter]MDA3966669.1 metallophosphoesterase family protein [Helicobacter sp. WB40]MDA3968563.1 metallophosphoesterase family protein [Helicobacter ibis]